MLDSTQSYEPTLDVTSWNIIRSCIWFTFALFFSLLAIGFTLLHCFNFIKIFKLYGKSTSKQKIVNIVSGSTRNIDPNGNLESQTQINVNNSKLCQYCQC